MTTRVFSYIKREDGLLRQTLVAKFGGTRHKGHPSIEWSGSLSQAYPWDEQDVKIILRRYPGTAVFQTVEITDEALDQSVHKK